MVNLIALYPGQGSQFPKMTLDLYAASQKVRDLFGLASEVCKKDFFAILEQGTAEELQDTRLTQLVVTLANRAAYIRLQELGMQMICHAGFSLGELSSYAGGGILDDETLFKIVQRRGILMADSAREAELKHGKLGMAAVIGLSFQEVESLLEAEKLEGLYCANDNGPAQVVLAGKENLITQAKQLLLDKGAKKVIPLRVSGPFHTPFMEEATVEFSTFLSNCKFSDPQQAVISSVHGDFVHSKEEALALLARQLASPLRWTATMQRIETFARTQDSVVLGELGAKGVLSGLWKSSGSFLPCSTLGTEEAIKLATQEYKENDNGY
ncbi:ACP S-malonyltransferase [uncultured Sphaerochaeta sp.]|uniref:ACP S-malonyltransferase n=1 Tax=uncultured Sphaerochaeta sp. TaxID=886478 RepID=UPI002A0A3471|nr:ACP S-malonyltransferase [uncultured Sphaerochaeta sp.]